MQTNMRIGVTSGLRGYFAVLYDNDGPIESGIGSYKNWEGAAIEALDWAQAEGVPVDASVQKFKDNGFNL
jgi:hypothetical protein